jgi:hypothetical protein
MLLTDLLVLAGFAAFIGVCVVYALLADRVVSRR